MKALIDTREPNPVELAENIRVQPGITEVELKELPAGDIVIGNCAFERKTWNDFASSMKEDRLEIQVEKMNEGYDHSYILIHGDYSDVFGFRYSDIDPNSVIGYAARLTADGTPVIPVSNLSMMAKISASLTRKHNEDSSRDTVIPQDPLVKSEPTTVRMFAAIDGVGPELAKRLDARCVTIAEASRKDPEDFTEVDGIGPSLAVDIHDSLHAPWRVDDD